MEQKKCNKCGRNKPVVMFYKLRKDRDWRRSICTDCHKRKDKRNRKVRLNQVN